MKIHVKILIVLISLLYTSSLHAQKPKNQSKAKLYASAINTPDLLQKSTMIRSDESSISDNHTTASDCGKYYYLTNNSEVEMTMYDRKDKPAMTLTYYISDVKNIPDGIQSKVRTEMKDKKGEVLGGGEGIFKCTDGSLSADMHVSVSSMPMKQFEGMDVKATEAYLVYPANMAAGQTLPDGAFHMDILRKGNPFATVDYTVEDRKVEGEEKIATPAGSWQCYRISYTVSMKIKMGISIPMHYKITEWFAPGFGVVKTKNYNKKGKPAGYSVLTKVKK